MSVATLVRALKDANEDWEWYATSSEMIGLICKDMTRSLRHSNYSNYSVSFLDVGAGDGRVLTTLKENIERWDKGVTLEVYAIEKSKIHIRNMPKAVVVVGTDFHEQTLVDKPFDRAFCNPPYSEYEEWTTKLIREASVGVLYLVIPDRWRKVKAISEAIKLRACEIHSLGFSDFLNADRRARARVEIVKVVFGKKATAAFDSAIEEMLPDLKNFDLPPDVVKAEQPKEDEWKRDVAPSSDNMLEALVMAYDGELRHLIETYRGVSKLDPVLLDELGVTKHTILNGLHGKTANLKTKYWKMLFDRFPPITKRLATKQRNAFLASLEGKAIIDFTEPNIFATLCWVTKWCNSYFDEQLIDLYKRLADYCNVSKYKSNQRVWGQGRWRYLQEEEKFTHYKLEYRLVLESTNRIASNSVFFSERNGLGQSAFEYLLDLVTIANNLRFETDDSPKNYGWRAGKLNTIMLNNGEPLVAVRAYKNGNSHWRVNKKVMLAINVEAGRLLGWLHSPEEAAEELKATKAEAAQIQEMFDSSFRISTNNILKLGDACRSTSTT
jgi:Domain of unknown function (DUF4942)